MRRASRGSNKNQKPNSYESRKLKAWMLAEFGDGITVECQGSCGRRLFYSEITKDRFPIPGRKGGRYVNGNIRPLCLSCNSREGAREAAAERRAAKEKRERRNARRRELYAEKKRVAAMSGSVETCLVPSKDVPDPCDPQVPTTATPTTSVSDAQELLAEPRSGIEFRENAA